METLTSRIFGEYVDSATPHADTLKRAAEIYENTFKQIRDDEAFDTIRRIPHTTPWYGLQRTAHLEALKSAAKYIKTHTTPQVGQPSKKRTFSTDTPMHLKEGLLDFIKYASSSDPHTTYSGLLDHIDQEITKNRKQQRKKEKGNLYETIDAQTPKDFETVTIDQIVGNSEAKIGIERQIKALSLYDPQLKKNPAYETGIMSYATLLDGVPGTGKSTLFKYAKTRLEELAKSKGLQHQVLELNMSEIKSKWYGESGQKLASILEKAKDPTKLTMFILDDVDMVVPDRNKGHEATNELTEQIMRFLSGSSGVNRGNCLVFAATNQPTALDPALRSRFGNRIAVAGPETAEDRADLTYIGLKDLINNGAVDIPLSHTGDYTPLATQVDMTHLAKRAEQNLEARIIELQASDEFTPIRSIEEFGHIMDKEIKENPILKDVAGRAQEAVNKHARILAANFDVPDAWYTTSDTTSYEQKVQEIRNLQRQKPLNADHLALAWSEFKGSEIRFRDLEEDKRADEYLKDMIAQDKARIKFEKLHAA